MITIRYNKIKSDILCKSVFLIVDSKDPIARKMRLRRRRDQEEADQDQAKILKVHYCLINHIMFEKKLVIIMLSGHEGYSEREEQG